MSKYSLSALVAAGLLAGGMSVSSASAADLGGNCCADLEERIAELEATTARKGNRKVSLTVSGWVGQQVMWWDDGQDSNVYIHDLGTTLGSHVKFTGQANIVPGWTAGYVLHIEAISSDSLTQSASSATGPALYNQISSGATGWGGTQVLQSYWFIKSDQLGKVGVGRQSQASDNAAILVDGSGSLVPANWVAFDLRSMSLHFRNGNPGGTWGATQDCAGEGGDWGDCNGLPQNVVRYDSPSFGGFSASASWGADDMWDVAARYAGEWNDFKVSAVVAYNEVSDANYNDIQNSPILGLTVPKSQYLQAGLYLEHIPTGIFGMVNYGHLNVESATGDPAFGGDQQTWYAKAGIRQRWNPLGHTVLYGEYLNGADGSELCNAPGCDSELRVWGGGIVQEIDAAAMSMWIKYRNLGYDDTVNGSADNFNEVAFGALINF
jgi:porin-like protein